MESNFNEVLKSFTSRVTNDVAKYDKNLTITTHISQRWGFYGIRIGNKSQISIRKKNGKMQVGQNDTGNLFDRTTWTRLIATAISEIPLKD